MAGGLDTDSDGGAAMDGDGRGDIKASGRLGARAGTDRLGGAAISIEGGWARLGAAGRLGDGGDAIAGGPIVGGDGRSASVAGWTDGAAGVDSDGDDIDGNAGNEPSSAGAIAEPGWGLAAVMGVGIAGGAGSEASGIASAGWIGGSCRSPGGGAATPEARSPIGAGRSGAAGGTRISAK